MRFVFVRKIFAKTVHASGRDAELVHDVPRVARDGVGDLVERRGVPLVTRRRTVTDAFLRARLFAETSEARLHGAREAREPFARGDARRDCRQRIVPRSVNQPVPRDRQARVERGAGARRRPDIERVIAGKKPIDTGTRSAKSLFAEFRVFARRQVSQRRASRARRVERAMAHLCIRNANVARQTPGGPRAFAFVIEFFERFGSRRNLPPA
mmetsp:Transcript_6782/g.27681  ORF Transcript_6782/g.27681 Transcript_6782/m.27681 type:complete len:211 (-) Transcript_6782:1555-2187(-)